MDDQEERGIGTVDDFLRKLRGEDDRLTESSERAGILTDLTDLNDLQAAFETRDDHLARLSAEFLAWVGLKPDDEVLLDTVYGDRPVPQPQGLSIILDADDFTIFVFRDAQLLAIMYASFRGCYQADAVLWQRISDDRPLETPLAAYATDVRLRDDDIPLNTWIPIVPGHTISEFIRERLEARDE